MRLCSQVLAEVDRSILEYLRHLSVGGERIAQLLDVGCWDGAATQRYAERLGAAARGIEIFDAPARSARQRGIDVAVLDLERQPFPWLDSSVDLVIVNQVFEHLKNVWLPMSQVFRVLRVGGRLIVSVPNLASFHNRVLLNQPIRPGARGGGGQSRWR